jgi:hypothetical protein
MTREDLQAWETSVGLLIENASGDLAILHALVHAFLFVREALAAARVSVARLKRLFVGPRSEKRSVILSKPSGQGQDKERPDRPDASCDSGKERKEKEDGESESKAEGHGRNGADQYVGAKKIPVPHPDFGPGDNPCPNEGCDGKVYRMKEPRKILRIVGQPALMAFLWLQERWRCNLCEVIFYAPLPAEAGEADDDKYDETAVAMIAILHFANGFAFHRLAQHQSMLGIPLSASVQSELLGEAYQKLRPVMEALIWHAAQCGILHNDDTGMKVLALLAQIKQSREKECGSKSKKKERTGIHTTGIVAITAAYRIALYFTGLKHAGENLAEVLEKREKGLPPPTHVSDGLGHNKPGKIPVDESKCMTHGRRQFTDIVDSFPEACGQVVDFIAEVYRVDAIAKKRNLSDEDRLMLHQEKSGPVMDRLRRWLEDQLLNRGVEPNSPLGKAISYILNRWELLTLFLRKPGVPLDNNIVERALKKAIRHRRNSLFFNPPYSRW